ncbi:MAG: MMPL family transporter [Kineosporiaceae bacterium]
MSVVLDPPGPRAVVPPAHDPGPGRSDPVARAVAGSAGHPWLVLVLGVLLVMAAAAGLGVGTRTTSADDQYVGESAVAQELLSGADFGERPTETVVVTAAGGGALEPAGAAGVADGLRRALAGDDRIAGVGEPVVSPDGTTALVPVALTAATDDPEGLVAAADVVAVAREDVAVGAPGLAVGQVGPGSVEAEIGEALEGDLRRAELLAIPVTLAVLLLAFGAGVAALVPVAVGLSSVVAALGLTALVSQVVPVDRNAQSLVLLIGLAVGVDYALFVLRRAREERASGLSPREAVVATGATVVRAVVVSGVTVVVAMAGLVVAGGMFTSLGIGTALVVLVSVLASATVLPALLAVLGDRVEALRLPWRRRRAPRSAASLEPTAGRTVAPSAESAGFWGRLASLVVRRPGVWGGVAVLALLALAAPALGMRTTLGGVESLPSGFGTVAAYESMTAAFPTEADTVDVVVRAGPSDAADVEAALAAAHATAVADAVAVGALDLAVSRDSTVHVLPLGVPGDATSGQARATLDDVRADVAPAVRAALAAAGVPAEVAVGGEVADVTDFSRWIDSRLPLVIGFVLALTLVVMTVSFGSPALAAATVGLNLLSVGAAYGVLTLVFQGTWAEGLLAFTSTGAIAAWLPLMLFVVLFGLSMDYHVFVVSRVREARLAGSDPRRAVVLGIARSAGVVTSAAAVMVAVFAIFGTLSMLEMKQMGVGLAAAVLLDATVVRGVLLPAVLAVLGDRAHRGPRWLPALHG